MVVKVKPFIIKCQACGWSKLVSPKSDVLMGDEFFEECPVCESEKIIKEDVGFMKSLLSFIKK